MVTMSTSSIDGFVVLIELYLVVLVVDVLLGWVQPDTRRLPRRLTHALTEPLQAPLRIWTQGRLSRGWDLSALLVIGAMGFIRLCLCQ